MDAYIIESERCGISSWGSDSKPTLLRYDYTPRDTRRIVLMAGINSDIWSGSLHVHRSIMGSLVPCMQHIQTR